MLLTGEHCVKSVQSKYGVFSGLYFPVFGLIQENTDQKRLRIWTLFTQWNINHQFYFHDQLHKDFNETAQRLQEDVRCIQSSAKTSSVVMKHIEGETFKRSHSYRSYLIKYCTLHENL